KPKAGGPAGYAAGQDLHLQNATDAQLGGPGGELRVGDLPRPPELVRTGKGRGPAHRSLRRDEKFLQRRPAGMGGEIPDVGATAKVGVGRSSPDGVVVLGVAAAGGGV